MAVEFISHKKSSATTTSNSVTTPKLPKTTDVAYGEIAVNYADGYETLSIKNSANEIITFSNDVALMSYADEVSTFSGDTGIIVDNENKIISISADTELDETSDNVVQNSAITKVIFDNELVVSSALNDLDDRKLDASAYTPTDLSNYYTKSETSGASEIQDALDDKQDIILSGYTSPENITSVSGVDMVSSADTVTEAFQHIMSGITDNELVVSNALNDLDDTKLDISAFTQNNAELRTLINQKQDAMTVDNELNSASTNTVQNAVITAALMEDERIISSALNDLDDRKLDASAYTPTNLSNYYTKDATSGSTQLYMAFRDKQDKVLNEYVQPSNSSANLITSGNTVAEAFQNIVSAMTDTELVVSSALNDLDSTKLDISDAYNLTLDAGTY